MKKQLIKVLLRIKLKQWSSRAGLAVIALSVARSLGYEIPPDVLPYIDGIGMYLAGIILILVKESGETDEIKDAKHQIEVAAHEIPTVQPAANPDQPKPRPAVLRNQPPVQPVTGDRTPRDADPANPGGGFNG